MYEILCETCGRVGVHPSRVGAESRAEAHIRETDHSCTIQEMEFSEETGV